MDCRPRCSASIAPAIRQPFWGMPDGKPAGKPVYIYWITRSVTCTVSRPAVCDQFKPKPLSAVRCPEALALLSALEQETAV